MSLVNFSAKNHRQQVTRRGADDSTDDRRTRPEIFDPLNEEFNFTLDAAASSENAKCSDFFDLSSNGLKGSWKNHRVWLNPPYSDLRPWVEKALAETANGCQLVVMLLPANRCEQKWWQELLEPLRDKGGRVETRFLAGRPRFDRPGWTAPTKGDRPPFGLVVVIIRKESP